MRNTTMMLGVLIMMLLSLGVDKVEATRPSSTRDVCIVGGGIGGMSAAVFLKDRGYNPLVIEKLDTLGGMCNTVTFPVANASLPNAIDIGVIAFINTTFFTEAGFGGWTIDSVRFFERFVGDTLFPVPIPLTAPFYNIDFSTGEVVLLPPINITQFTDALEAYFGFLASNPYLTTFINKPDPIPAELLVPFSQYVEEHGYQPLVQVFRDVIAGGITNYTALSMWEALRMAVNVEGVLSITESIGSQFAVEGGCIRLYEGMAAYLGSENVWTSADIQTSVRPPAGIDFPSTLAGVRKVREGESGVEHERPFVQVCEKLIIAVPPLLHTLEQFLDLDEEESALFSKVRHYNYYVTTADVEGPITSPSSPQDFIINNYEVSQPNGLPVSPTLVNMFRGFTYGPATVGMSSQTSIPIDEMLEITQAQLNNSPPSLITSATLSRANAKHHIYQPHFPTSELRTSPDAYTRLNNLQGHRNTYYSGSILTAPSHVLIINWANQFINATFPAH